MPKTNEDRAHDARMLAVDMDLTIIKLRAMTREARFKEADRKYKAYLRAKASLQ